MKRLIILAVALLGFASCSKDVKESYVELYRQGKASVIINYIDRTESQELILNSPIIFNRADVKDLKVTSHSDATIIRVDGNLNYLKSEETRTFTFNP